MSKTVKCTTLEEAYERVDKIFEEADTLEVDEVNYGFAVKSLLEESLSNLAGDCTSAIIPEVTQYIDDWLEELGIDQYIPKASTIFNKNITKEALQHAREQDQQDRTAYDDIITRRSEVKRTFIKKYFGQQGNSQLYFMRQAKNGFIETFIADRAHARMVRPEEINDSVRRYKQQLINDILDYFRIYRPQIFENLGLEETDLFDKNGSLTTLLNPESELVKAILREFNSQVLATNGTLEEYYKQYKEGNEKSKAFLDAYNAWVLLNEFDTALSLTLKDLIKIDPTQFNSLGNSSYETNIDKATNMWSFGLGDENADIADIVSDVTQLLIGSSRLYHWKGMAKPDAYLHFSDFNYIIGKIKALVFSPEAKNIVIDLDTTEIDPMTFEEKSLFSNLSDISKSVIRQIEVIHKENGETEQNGKVTLAQLISYVSENPQRVWHAISEILCETDILEQLKQGENIPYFSRIDKDLLYSIHKEIFGTFNNSEETRSLFDLHNNTPGDHNFEIITQIADTMFAEDFIQYYQNDDGSFSTRMLKDLAIQQIKAQTLSEIQETNGWFDTDRFKAIQRLYNIQINKTEPTKVTESFVTWKTRKEKLFVFLSCLVYLCLLKQMVRKQLNLKPPLKAVLLL